jgi:hypothetical protein
LSALTRPEQVVYFFRQVVGVQAVDKEVLSRRTGEYQDWVEAFARNHDTPIEWAEKGVRKEDYVQRWLRSMVRARRYGVYFIFKSMEQGPTFRCTVPKYPTRDPHHRILAPQRSRFTHYYFYIHDETLGPIAMRVASFFAFQTTYYLNGHSFIEQELNRAGIGFRKNDNAFVAVDDPAALQAAADRLPYSAMALLTTTASGNLAFEVIEGHGGTSNQELGLGTPPVGTPESGRDRIFTIHLVNENVASVSPSALVDKGFVPAGTVLNFYNLSDYNGIHWAYSSTLISSPSFADLEVFTDRNNSLSFGGSAVEVLGPNDWMLHLDDAASSDDDDSEMVIRVLVTPSSAVPEPSAAVLTLVLLGALSLMLTPKRRPFFPTHRSAE